MSMVEQLKHARRVSVPLVSITTADQMAAVKTICKSVNGDGTPMVLWDLLRGTNPLNEAGKKVAKMTGDGDEDATVGNPAKLLELAIQFPERTMVFVLNWDQYLKEEGTPAVLQGCANLRDEFKQDGRMLLMMSPGLQLPTALKDDVVSIDEELPNDEQLKAIVVEQDQAATTGKSGRPLMDEETLARSVEAVQGLNAFAAETAVAMALRAKGIDLDHAWASKKTQVEMTKGLSIYRGGENFASLGGLNQIKQYLRSIMTGRRQPKTLVWLDEIEKTGLGARSDTSGVNQDQEGTLLSYMEDQDVYGVMLLGAPGCGKSAICKAAGAEFGRVVIRLDMGALMGSLVGQSQQQLRQALKVIAAVGGNDTMWLATSNSIDNLSGAMRSRFTDIFFFDLPVREERQPIWDVWMQKYELADKPYADDDGWVGRNIRKCCEKAYRMDCSVEGAAQYIVPVGVSERDEIERLRKQADGCYLSASYAGAYRVPKSGSGKRSLAV
jgi:hypothetical protein